MSFFSGSDLQIYPASFKVMGLPSLRFRVTAFLRCLAWIRHDQTTQPTILSKSKKLKGDSFRVTNLLRFKIIEMVSLVEETTEIMF